MNDRLKRETQHSCSYVLFMLLNDFTLHINTLYINQIVTKTGEKKKMKTEQFTYRHRQPNTL